MKIKKIFLQAIFLSALFPTCLFAMDSGKSAIEAGFLNPPDSARPRVWWHWMNGNVTKEGIKADLEWMKRAGIAGFQNFDAALSTPQIVDKRLIFMTPEWKDAFRYTTKLADSLGLEMAIAGSPGWSESGGPWVTPAQAMKKYVWSETRVEGGKPFSGILPKPPTTTGAFQNLALVADFSANVDESAPTPEFYADAAVVAFRLPDGDKAMTALNPKVTSSGGDFDLSTLTDGDVAKSVFLPEAPRGGDAWIQFEFERPESIQSLTIVGGGESGFRFPGTAAPEDSRFLEVSDDGKAFRRLFSIPSGGVKQTTIEFSPVTSKYFRVAFKTVASPAMPAGLEEFVGSGGASAPAGFQIAELVLHTGARVNYFEDKAAFDAATDIASKATQSVAEVVRNSDVVNLTSEMTPDGKLNWTPGAGNWVVLRIGYSLKGTTNHPASPEATGLEVDKLSAEHVRSYFTDYLDQYRDATDGLMGKKGLQYIITDSWEAGTMNWTDNMMDAFETRRGYSMDPWLPVLAGYVVESAEASDRFLWDFRKTIADLTVENHYDLLTKILKERGMGRYSESHEMGRALIADGMAVKRTADIPMSATWMPGMGGSSTEVSTGNKADVRESASVAHLYGKPFVAAESLTAMGKAWSYSPETLKPVADMEMANGLNRFVIHCSVHQPVDDKIPGLGLGPFGQWFTRHETWAEEAIYWTTYLARSCYMLQQGKFVADVVYFYGEDNNITNLFSRNLPDIPEGFNYDFVNADALVNLLSVEDGSLTSPSGMRYHLMALDKNSRQMSLPVLRKISELVKAGAVVVGSKPLESPSLQDDPVEFKRIADELWENESGENRVGNGKIYAGLSVAEVLAAMGVTSDFSYTRPMDDTNLMFVHRTLGDMEIYWVNNRNNRSVKVETTFRVDGKAAEIWNPETGGIEKVSYKIADRETTVPLDLKPNDAVFVVFRGKAKGSSFAAAEKTEVPIASIDGPWDIHFQSGRGAPAEITMDQLSPWNENRDEGIKYFSGTGTYTKTIQAPADWFEGGRQLWLDLGNVKNLAEVVVNGKSLGVVWKTPFKVNVTDALKPGGNQIEVRVTNLWVNRLIGDRQPDATQKYTYTTQVFYKADSPLQPSGLLGPVRLVGIARSLP